jgi:hypothetical protein
MLAERRSGVNNEKKGKPRKGASPFPFVVKPRVSVLDCGGRERCISQLF